MTKSKSHKNAQAKAAGQNGTTEHKLPNGQKLDALSANGKRTTEVELSGNYKAAVNRLKISGANQKVLQVPNHCIDEAVQAMKDAGVSGTVKNMGGTKRKSV
jgi:hypothetical protein